MPENHSEQHHHFGYEKKDISARVVLISVAVFVVFMVVSFIALKGYLNIRYASQPAEEGSRRAGAEAVRMGPKLLKTADMGLPEMRAAEDSVLSSYGWVHPDSGLVRIPIERAMAILAKKGLPVRADGRTDESGSSGNSE